jgi:hypothetical protein
MTDARGGTRVGRGMAKATPPGPWHFATLVLPCSRCDAAPGDPCTWPNGSERGRFHFERYAVARELAGFPLRRSSRT